MSPRAACRLETLGFEHVYDYVSGKVDWLARGLATEGEKATEPRASHFVRDNAVTCGLNEQIGDVARRVAASPYGFALVVSDGGVLLGRLRQAALDGEPHTVAGDVMEPGPSTVRADTPADALRQRLQSRNLRTAVVTTPEGVLLGIVLSVELEAGAATGAQPAASSREG
jgi:CBS-domain-containing membrane protein